MPETPLQTLLRYMGQEQPKFLPPMQQQPVGDELRQRFMEKLAQQQPPLPPSSQQPTMPAQPGGLPMPPNPREIGRMQMDALRRQAAIEVLGPKAQVPGYQGPSPHQLAQQGPTMGAAPSGFERFMASLRPAAKMAEAFISPVDAETGMPNVAIGPLSGVGSADDAGKLTARVLKRADIRKGLDFASDAEKANWDDFLKSWADDTPLLPQETVPFEAVQQAAESLDPSLARKIIKRPPKDAMQSMAVFQHARNRLSELNATILRMSEQLKNPALSDAERYATQSRIGALEKDAAGYLDWIFKTGSQHGRELAMHKIMAKQSLDDVFWLDRARRMGGGTPLEEEAHRKILEALSIVRDSRAAGNKPREEAALAALGSVMTSVQKATKLETLSAVRKAGLLTGPKTVGRNLSGNVGSVGMDEVARLPGSVADWGMSLFTNQRTVMMPNPRAVAKSAIEGATKGWDDFLSTMKHGATPDQLQKFDFPKELYSGSRALDKYVNTVMRLQSASDKPFRAYAFRRSIEEQAKAMAITAKHQGTLGNLTWKQMADTLSQTPSETMIQNAIGHAEFATFANKNQMTEAIRRGSSALSPGGRFALDMVLPFKSTPANVVGRVMEYAFGAPVGLVKATKAVNKAMTPEQQSRIAMMIGRGTVGPAVMYLGYKLAESGQLTGMVSENPSDRAVAEAAGRLPGAIQVDGKWQQVGSMSPWGNLLVTGASIYETTNRTKNPADIMTAMGGAALRSVKEQPMLTGMEDVTQALGSEAGAEKFFQGMGGSFVPTAVGDVGRLLDPLRRETRGMGLGASILERTPFLRETLPERRDVLGTVMRNSPGATVNPAIGSPALELTDPVRKALLDYQVGMGWPQKQRWEPPEEYRKKAAVMGANVNAQIKALLDSDEWRSEKDPDRRREMIERRISAVRSMVSQSLRMPGMEKPEARQKFLDSFFKKKE